MNSPIIREGLTLYEGFKDHSIEDLGYCFTKACEHGDLDLEVVRYLLTTKELGKNAEIEYDNHVGFRVACSHGHFKIVKYLLTSDDLKKHSDITSKDNEGLQYAACFGH